AAAEKKGGAAFGGGVMGGCSGRGEVAGGGGWEPAAAHRAMQYRHYGRFAVFDALERAVPAAGMGDALRDIARGELGEIEPRAEMLAFSSEHDCLDRVRQGSKKGFYAEHGRIVDGVALLRPRQAENGDVAAALGLERARQFNVEAASGFSHAILAASKSGTGSVTFLEKRVKTHTIS